MPHAWMRVGAAAAAVAMIFGTPPHLRSAGSTAAQGHSAAESWIQEDLASADRVAAALYDDGLGAEPVAEAGAERRGHRAMMFGVKRWTHHAKASDAMAVFPAHRLDDSTGAVEVAVDATGPGDALRVEARGMRADGGWTEWHEVNRPTARDGDRIALSEQIDQVQVRVGLAGDPETRVSGVRVRPVQDPAEHLESREEPYSARLFATRIGLVGNRTANGETVRPNAHFVALPSRRGLAVKGGGEYTVRVCTTGTESQRCAYAPVWDVGPWNTRDDHWNADREMWGDLPHGTPQAQTAHLDGYNDGRDGFGRAVRNPAGIDLADGTFRQGLELTDNAWVQVDYLWTGSYENRAEVRSDDEGFAVVVRSDPDTWAPNVGMAAHNAHVGVICQVGDAEETDDVWYRIGEDHYIPASNAIGGDTAPQCGTETEAGTETSAEAELPTDTVRISRG